MSASAPVVELHHGTCVDNRFMVEKRIGGGSFGEIYLAFDTKNKIDVALKVESIQCKHPQISYEAKIYKLL